MDGDFRERCASALTHPVTVGALAVLLVNDLALKAVWPESWATGKLSDLAWVIFASPLLAFLLSFLTRGKPWAERSVVGTAYIGLPVLYAAFNTFGPLHDWILAGLLFFTDSAAGSPLDPTDSLVIPFGLAAAVWVWRRRPVEGESLRIRMCVQCAVIASLATVASTVAERNPTEWLVGFANDGTLVIAGPYRYEYYESTDGGLTWAKTSRLDWESEITWGGREVETPRGKYVIEGTEILRMVRGGQPQVAHSVSYLTKGSNGWAQRYETRKLRLGLSFMSDDPERYVVTEPGNMVYDPSTGNIVAAMRIQGALVENPNGEWIRIGVGRFVPTDFSFLGKTRTMFSTYFWLSSLAAILCLTAVSLGLSHSGSSIASSGQLRLRRFVKIALVAMAGIVVISSAFVLIFGLGLLISLILAVFPLALIVALTVFALSWPRQHMVRKLTALAFVLVGLLMAIGVFPPFAGDTGALFELGPSFLASGALLFSSLGFVLYRPSLTQITAIGAASGVMLVSIALPFTLWLTGGLVLWMATIAAVALLGLTAFMLRQHLRRQAIGDD